MGARPDIAGDGTGAAMPDESEPAEAANVPACECWQLLNGNGHVTPAGVLTRYPLLAVQTTVEISPWLGRPWGTCWAGRSGTRSRHLLVLRGEQVIQAVPESTLQWVSPIRSDPHLIDSMERFMVEVRNRLEPADEAVTITRDADHGQIEFTIRTRAHNCEPGPDPLRHPDRLR